MSALADSYQLPPPGEALTIARDRLSNDDYRILVVGEVKRGKSTLVNALTGLKLPTDVDVATSQVFRIRHADEPYYRVRYADGGERQIRESELGQYGSQVVVDAEGVPDPHRTIQWIEIGLPYTFLPRNVSLLDTPGVGGIKADHGEITHKFLPQADAVIFVLDSDRPIDDIEVRFLESVLRGTRHVFFVQTKIDVPKEPEWQAIRAKNETRIKEKFGKALSDTTVWPLSSVLLQRAAKATAHADLRLIESRHREFAPALSAFLYRVIGWSRAADAILLAEHHHNGGGETLVSRHRSLADTSRRFAEEFRGRLQHARRSVEEAGSGFNKSRNLAFERLRDEARRAGRWIEDQISEVRLALKSRINHVSSGRDAEELGGTLADAVMTRASEAWRDVRRDGIDLYGEVLSDLFLEAEEELRFHDPRPNQSLPHAPKFEGDFLTRVYTARNHSMTAGFTVGVPAGILVAVGVIAPPVAVLAGSVAAIWGLISGWRISGRSEASAAKGKLYDHLETVVHATRINYLRGTEDLFRTLERSLREQTDHYAEQKRSEAAAELGRLEDEDRMTQQQRADGAKKVEGQMLEWRKLGEELATVRGQLNRLHEWVSRGPGGAS
jgi:GTPase SAR1 family protein